MTYRCQLAFVMLGSLLVAACSFIAGGRASFEDFQAEVKLAAGAAAADCGHVILGADRSAANCCVATNFRQSLPFSVTFDEQGIDSRVARGLAQNARGTTTIYIFDSDLTGGNRANNGVIYSETCKYPTLINNPCNNPSGFPLSCQ